MEKRNLGQVFFLEWIKKNQELILKELLIYFLFFGTEI